MLPTAHRFHLKRRGTAFILSMIFVLVFAALSVSLATLSGTNVQVASNQHRVNTALHAAQSGLECAKYLVRTVALESTNTNHVTDAQANQVWTDLCAHVQAEALDGKSVPAATRFADAAGGGDELVTPALSLGSPNVDYAIRFYRYDSNPRIIKIQSVGTSGPITRRIAIDMDVTKDREVLNYAIACRGRTWLTGNTTIHGDLYSSWDRVEISPFNVTSGSSVLGTINTVLELDGIKAEDYDMETLDANDMPLDIHGNVLDDNYEDRYYGPDDEVQGHHEGINYGMPDDVELPGMDIADYNTDAYSSGLTDIDSRPAGDRVTEYFPHASGDYGHPRDGTPGNTWNQRLTRHVYESETFTNARLPEGRQALFRNCTFEEVLYIDCRKSSTSSTSYTNNVRFENCTFNGVIVTEVPQTFNWRRNCLYFTGTATFDNQSSIRETTVLAPHFNVNLGNTNPQQSDKNVLTGAIVGGIVDVRGNAQVDGTIISMFDTTAYSSGYVTNIGATLDDGGSETAELGDIGTIEITPEEDMMLPSGISSPIVIEPDQDTYCESA